jgi:iron(III) transport system permease protein
VQQVAAPERRAGLRLPALSGRTVVTVVVIGVLVYLILGPLVMLVMSSFKSTEGALPFEAGVPWTLQNYADVFLDGSTYRVLFNTLIFAAGSLALSFTLSIAFAWLIERTDMPFRNLLFIVIIASIGIPNVIAGIAWGLLGSPINGLINLPLQAIFGTGGAAGPLNVYTLPGLIFVQGITLVPITFLLVAAAFRGMDTTMEDAAAASGARFRTVMRRVTVPLLTPALLSALIYQFVTVVESFDIPLIIGLRAGIPLLSTQVFIEAKPPGGLPDYGLASSYSMLLLVMAIGPLIIYNRAISHSERFATITGHTYQPRRMSLGGWRWVAAAFALAYVLIAFVLPLLIMIWTSLQPFYAVPSAEALGRITFDAYGKLLDKPQVRDALFNTLLLGTATAAFTMTIGVLVSWILVRSRSRLKPILDVLAFMPHAFPGVIIGLSILLIYLLLPLPIYGTIWILVIALGTQYISLSTRLMTSGIAQVQRQLEEAAETSGAGWGATMRRIVLPLIRPAFLTGVLLVFLSAIKNLTLALILFTPGSIVLSTLIYSSWDRADTSTTAALGVVMVVLTLVLALITRRISSSGTAQA